MKGLSICLLAVVAFFVCSSSIAVADCPDKKGVCWIVPECSYTYCAEHVVGEMDYGTCSDWFKCKPCHSQGTYRDMCAAQYGSAASINECNCNHWRYSFRNVDGEEIHK